MTNPLLVPLSCAWATSWCCESWILSPDGHLELERWFGERVFLLQKPWVHLFRVQSLCYLRLSLLPALIGLIKSS